MAASSHAAELQAVKDNLRDLRGQLKRLHDPATPEPGRCTRVRCPETERTATMVFLMTQENEDMAELYVQQKRRNATVQNPWPRGHFGIRCSGWTDADKAEMLAPTTPKGRAAVRAATNFVEQHGLQVWVRGQNELKALAPSTTAAADEALRVCPGGTPDAHAQRWKHRRYGRQWVRRWAARFRLVRGRFHIGPGLPLETARAKARRTSGGGSKNNRSPFSKSCIGIPELGTIFRPQKRS